MGAIKNILEPVAIALAFTFATVINRRSRRRTNADQTDALDPLFSRDGKQPSNGHQPTADARSPLSCANMHSKCLNHFPFLMEIWYWNLTYWVYQLFRAYSASLIRDDVDVWKRSESHALTILALEQNLGIAIEQPIQHFILTYCPRVMSILAVIYHSHIIVGVVFVAYTYTYMPSHTFQSIRRTLAIDNWIAFAIFTAWRCMPPRLLPVEYGFVDVLHAARAEHSQTMWTDNKFQLTIAAMPSLHFGTSMLIGTSLWKFSPHQWIRTLSLCWPATMFLTIIATANHWVLDAVVGACIPLLGWRFNEAVLWLMPIENLLFRALKLSRPIPSEPLCTCLWNRGLYFDRIV